MNPGNCLSKHRHDDSVRGIRSRKFHIVSELVWRDALQHELAGISVFAFIALERNSKEPNSDCNDESKNDYRQNPPCKLQELSVNVSLTQTKAAIPMRNGRLQLKVALEISGEPLCSAATRRRFVCSIVIICGYVCTKSRGAFFPARSRIGFRCRPGGGDDFCVPACLEWRISVG